MKGEWEEPAGLKAEQMRTVFKVKGEGGREGKREREEGKEKEREGKGRKKSGGGGKCMNNMNGYQAPEQERGRCHREEYS